MKVRLHLDQPLAPGPPVALSREASNYLFAVLRLEVGAGVLVFNGQQGEFAATVTQANKKNGALLLAGQTRPVQPPPDLWLCCAPIKRARFEMIVEKAVELGIARLVPVLTEYTNAERLRPDKLRAQMIEAAEQCEAVFVPELADPVPLAQMLQDWPADRRILWADEAWDASHATLAGLERGRWAVLIGPEGGFSPSERARLRALPCVTPLSLGPRILRAETAAIAALSLWQAHLGVWP